MREWSIRLSVEKVRTPEGVPALVVADADRAEPAPLVLVVHGLRSRKERHLELCLHLARAGLTAVALDAAFHGERATAETDAVLFAPESSLAFSALFAHTIIETVADLPVLARHLGHERYGLIGHSMGGYIAFKAASTDPMAAAVVTISGNPDWAQQAEEAGMPPEIVAGVREQSPLTHAAAFYPRPILMLHGDSDATVPIHGVRALYESLYAGPYGREPERVSLVEYPGVGHDVLPDMLDRAVDWMHRHLLPEANP